MRLDKFLEDKSPRAAQKAYQAIQENIALLTNTPLIGKPVKAKPSYRDLFIRFGAAGYVLRYRTLQNNIYISELRHYRENKF